MAQRLVPLWIVVIATACGRVGFHGAAADAARAPPSLVATSTGRSTDPAVLAIPIPRAAAGDLIVVGVTIHSSASVVRVGDGAGNRFTPAGRAAMNSTAAEVWFEANTAPIDSVTVMLTATGGYDVWVAEFAGAGGMDTHAELCAVYPPQVAIAAVTPTMPDELVFGVTMLAAPDSVQGVAAPFAALATQSGNGAAYQVATQPGTYGPAWTAQTTQRAVTCSTTVAFLPGA
jgi:hypothetical protein